MRASLFAFTLLAACGSTKPPSRGTAEPPPASCDAIHVSLEGTATADEPVRLDALAGADATAAMADAEAAGNHAATAACHDDYWSVEAIECFTRATTDDDQRACTANLPAAVARSLRTHVDAAVHALGAVALTRGTVERWRDVPADTGVPACDDFIRGFNALMRCDKMPDRARDSAAGAVTQMMRGFAQLRDPNVAPDVKQHAIDGCTKALTVARQSAAEMGCPMP